MSTTFRRALENGNPIFAEATTREVGRITLAEALELTALIAQREPARHGRVATRWLHRYPQEPDPSIDEIALVVGCLVALSGRWAEHGALGAARRDLRDSETRRAFGNAFLRRTLSPHVHLRVCKRESLWL